MTPLEQRIFDHWNERLARQDDLWRRFAEAAPHLDIGVDTRHTHTMRDMTRDELNAHLENQNLKVDARLKDFTQAVADSMSGINHRLDLIEQDISSVKGIKGVVITTAVASTLAIGGILVGVLGYGVSAFDSGRDTSAAIQEMKQQSIETRQLLEQIKAQQAAQPAATAPPSTPPGAPQQ